MTNDELKNRVGQILSKEEVGPEVDWELVSCLSAQLAQELDEAAPTVVWGYIDEVERRRTDAVFAHAQRAEIISYLRG